MTQEPTLNVLWLQGFPQQGISLKVDHSQSQVLARTPKGAEFVQFIDA
jgi:hypothetical protein